MNLSLSTHFFSSCVSAPLDALDARNTITSPRSRKAMQMLGILLRELFFIPKEQFQQSQAFKSLTRTESYKTLTSKSTIAASAASVAETSSTSPRPGRENVLDFVFNHHESKRLLSLQQCRAKRRELLSKERLVNEDRSLVTLRSSRGRIRSAFGSDILLRFNKSKQFLKW